MNKKEANYWPHAIVLSIFFVIGLCVWTVKVAIENPVEEDYSYFLKYQTVNAEINKILINEEAFNKKYDVVLANDNFIIGKNSFVFCQQSSFIKCRLSNDNSIKRVSCPFLLYGFLHNLFKGLLAGFQPYSFS